MELTLVSTNPQRGPGRPIVVTTKDDALDGPVDAAYALVGAIDAAYDLLVAQAAGADAPVLQPQEEFQVWQGDAQAGAMLGTLTILPDPDDFEYRAAVVEGD